ncbi:MAG TPA: primary-amine oxidase [Thermomicrobiales bacterium]|nr:primary-amine oxidase [Thermomicrobiales bacterium]
MSREENDRFQLVGGFSRRSFLGASTATAAVWAAGRFAIASATAAENGARPAAASETPHPLDPLTAGELEQAVAILRREKQLGDSWRFVTVALAEPTRTEIVAYRPGQPFARQAFALIMDTESGQAFEATVDLSKSQVARYEPLAAGLQPPIMLDEFVECEAAIKRSAEFRKALEKRGVRDVNLVMVDPWSAGMYGAEPPEDRGKRLSRALCWVRSEPYDNGYARPLDGVVVVVDLAKMEVVRVEDYGVVPLPPTAGNWAREYIAETREAPKPLVISQPEGPSFTLEGREVRWQKWRFRIGFNPREGLVLHQIAYQDGERERPVLRRASVCEMVVPYGDPSEGSYRKNAFDIGEYGIGMMANSLVLGCDCLGAVRYLDADLADSRGRPITIKNAICLHEEDAGLLWKHTDWRTGQSESRRSRRLSVSFIATVGNYEYGFFWHFYQDGTIQCEVKLTGIMNTTALAPGEAPQFGVEIAPRLKAPFHQHIFAARLDTAIDGETNSLYEVNMVSLPRGSENPHGNAFRAEATLLATEQAAQRATNSATARFWRIVNPAKKNRLGQPVGYRLMPGENCPVLVQPNAAVMKRAGFLAHQLWATPYDAAERYPAGDYPNQHPTGDGLPHWTKANRPLDGVPLVAWYVFGHAHAPRPEDWPVMPVASFGFMLKPDGFFEQSPAMDLPAEA